MGRGSWIARREGKVASFGFSELRGTKRRQPNGTRLVSMGSFCLSGRGLLCPTTRLEGGFHAGRLGSLADSLLVVVELAAYRASANAFQFPFCLRLIRPGSRQRKGPVGQPSPVLRRLATPALTAGPTAVLRPQCHFTGATRPAVSLRRLVGDRPRRGVETGQRTPPWNRAPRAANDRSIAATRGLRPASGRCGWPAARPGARRPAARLAPGATSPAPRRRT